MKGSQELILTIQPVVLEGRGVEAWLRYYCFDTQRLDRSFELGLALRISESTDIVGTVIDCWRQSASLLNIVPQDAIMAELTRLPNLQDISDSYAPPSWVRFEEDLYAFFSKWWRPDPLCCQANGYEPSVKNTTSSDLSHVFQGRTIYFHFSCYIQALEYSLPRTPDGPGRKVMIDRTPLKLDVFFRPHGSSYEGFVMETISGSKTEENEHHPFGSIEQTVDMTRSRSVDCLIRRPEVKDYVVCWYSRHGSAWIGVEKSRIDLAAVPKASGTYNTRNAAKRKR